VDLADEYLCIPEEYSRSTGGLRWAPAGDAVDRGDGATYAFSFQIGAFLEGYLANGPLIHFAYVLHLLGFLRRSDPAADHGMRGLVAQAFQAAGRSHRNAGAFFATICREVAIVPGPPVPMDLLWRLQYPPHTQQTSSHAHPSAGTSPPRPPDWFEGHVVRSLEAYGFDELLHWFRNGTGPVKDVAPLVDAVAARPVSLAAILAEVGRRERLAGALPYVDQFVGALTLPRRRLERHDLPIGGYDDVTTRGEPAQLLPSQLALDRDEFVRRFAGGELLYFRREEPHARTREELVVLLDQGVRTWGPTRLMLAGAALALGRYAIRRRLALRVATTSGNATLDPTQAEPDALASLVEASDLSNHPAEALERVLDEATASPCDVVLLTHPRNLAEPDVAAAARRVRPGVRLFALTVTPAGAAELTEVRRGLAVGLLRFRVDSDTPPVPPVTAAGRTTAGIWTGDVEPIPYPFRFGSSGYNGTVRLAFDHSSDWLLIATRKGMLHAVRTNGSGAETWPRPTSKGGVAASVEAVVGVAGGFAVVGGILGRVIVAHYDLASRTARVYDSGMVRETKGTRSWWYQRRTHSVVVAQSGRLWRLELSSGGGKWAEGVGPSSFAVGPEMRFRCPLRSPGDADRRSGLEVSDVRYASANPLDSGAETAWPFLALDPQTGALTIHNPPVWREFTPLSDGKPLLKYDSLVDADCRGATLAALFLTGRAKTLRVFRGPEGVTAGEIPLKSGTFALSDDGRLLALVTDLGGLRVLDAPDCGLVRTTLAAGRFHGSIEVEIGDESLALSNGVCPHVLRWGAGILECDRATAVGHRPKRSKPSPQIKLPDSVSASSRFVKCSRGSLVAAVDGFGQVAVLEYSGNLVCMFFSFRHEIAAWMPDGTCHGSQRLLLTQPTPGAAEKIGTALKAASARSPGRVTG
jgi:hypothetical protein